MADLKMTTRPGYTGALNPTILERVKVVSAALSMPQLEERFPHLRLVDGSWRKDIQLKDGEIDLAQFIDHTQLKAAATLQDIKQLCEEAEQQHFKAVCVNGCRVALCRQLLQGGANVDVACVCGFPLGQMTSTMKAAEASEAIDSGAHEIDMVINVGALKEKDYPYVYADIKLVKDACAVGGALLKVIFETCLLTEEEIIDACILSVAAGADYVKTSTGFSTAGSTPEGIDIMVATVGNAAKVKASGGVRDRETALQYVKAGVSRIGTSSGIKIVAGPQTAPTGEGSY